jgi:hypothetical protein
VDIENLPTIITSRIVYGPDCWEWAGWHNDQGYGYVQINKRSAPVHRFIMEMLGRVQPRQDVDHLCRNRGCVNPAHLEGVSHAENVRRGNAAKNRPTCKYGHDLTNPANVYVYPTGRNCKPCAIGRSRRRWAERRSGGPLSMGVCDVTVRW